ncbi:MAG: chemotaxis protein CheA [bacterium]
MELDQYIGLFIDESRENLQKLNESLLKLESNPGDLEVLNDIFRVAHTLKGMSKTMGFNAIGDLTHQMEDVLDPLRSGTIVPNSKLIDVLFKCLDKLETLVEQIINNEYSDNLSSTKDLISDLKDALSSSSTGSAPAVEVKKEADQAFNQYEIAIAFEAAQKGFTLKEVTIHLVSDCVLPGVRSYMANSALETLGEVIKSIPEAEALENGEFEKSFKLFLVTKSDNKTITDIIMRISEIEAVDVGDVDLTALNSSYSASIQSVPSNAEEKTEEKSIEEKETIAANQTTITKAMPQTIRVNAGRLDKLMNLVGELVISRTRIAQISNELKENDLSSAISSMGNITTDIQEIVMKLRMVSIEQVFNRFPRLVRDLSKELKKEVNLKITGKETEIDRVVIDEIGDPLVHLIRNSLDHGLENPQERIEKGKSSKGTIELSAFNEGDNILIKVVDDGKGIDPVRLKQIAVKKGLMTEEQTRNLSEAEALDIIFMPGFSTTQVATDISGRGVGMDVVKTKIAMLGGTVYIDSKVNIGTTITISLPSTMAIVQALLVKVIDETYAMPLNYISEVIEIYPNQVKKVQNKEVIVLRGHTLPLVRLQDLLSVPNGKTDPKKPLIVVIVKSQGKSVGVIVSQLIGQQEVVIKPISKKLHVDEYISGATTLGNGRVALIINVNSLIKKNKKE